MFQVQVVFFLIEALVYYFDLREFISSSQTLKAFFTDMKYVGIWLVIWHFININEPCSYLYVHCTIYR